MSSAQASPRSVTSGFRNSVSRTRSAARRRAARRAATPARRAGIRTEFNGPRDIIANGCRPLPPSIGTPFWSRASRWTVPTCVLTVRHAEVARAARAGQFVMIKAGTSAEPPLRRPFSILTVDPEGRPSACS